MLGRTRRFLRRMGDQLGLGLALMAARMEQQRPPLLVRDGERPLGTRVALFCHFDAHHRVADYAKAYISELDAAGYSVVFVSNSGELVPEALEWLTRHCSRIILRRNVGYDFAAWRDGLQFGGFDATRLDMLLVVNDSVYGPFGKLPALLQRIDFGEADVWGCTDSWQIRYHLQSYFLAFGPAALASPAFREFWDGVGLYRSKRLIVRKYEIGLTQLMLRRGLRCRAIWPYLDLVDAIYEAEEHRRQQEPTMNDKGEARLSGVGEKLMRKQDLAALKLATARKAMNPVCDLWRPLLQQGFPFVKRELLRDNPTKTADYVLWRKLSDAIPEESRRQIVDDLRTVLRNVTP